jgi:RNA polymerase sigma factor (sigma-70 family)
MASEAPNLQAPSSSPTPVPAADGEPGDRPLLERFVRARDEAAFAALVQRHGPMVMGVCRRLLDNAYEAEDAFQATFLVLASKARSIGRPELLGPWLHGVASRIAMRARQAARRRAREREAPAMPDNDPTVEVLWRELQKLLDEELGGLAEKYRTPLVLFYLEGKSTEEVARLLDCPKGTVLSRLARGRDQLHRRLVRRGVSLSLAALVGVLIDKAVPAAVPLEVAQGTIKAAVLTAAGEAAGVLPATVAALMKGELRVMFLNKLKVMAAGLLALCVAVAVAIGGARQALADKKEAAKDEKKEAAKDEKKILGTWKLVSYEEGGQKAPKEKIEGARVIIAAGGKMTMEHADGNVTRGTCKFDHTQKPRQFDFTNDKKRTMPGIYKLDGDTLTVCYDRSGDRPTEFASKDGSTVVLQVLKREKK